VLLKDELNIGEKDLHPFVKRQFQNDDLTSPIASGSNRFDAYVVLPCSTSTLGKIASGIGDTLITRTAQVALKERFRMVLCVRETPMSTITLEQCAMLSREGVVIMPISPPLYYVPKSVDEYATAFTEKLLGVLGLRTSKGWRGEELE
jgi:4-hydroxy-3-polyprenylbenzoate decarboxylase